MYTGKKIVQIKVGLGLDMMSFLCLTFSILKLKPTTSFPLHSADWPSSGSYVVKDQFLWVSLIILYCLCILYLNVSYASGFALFRIYLVQQRLICYNFQDLNNFEIDPEEFARIFCKDGIDGPEVGVSLLTWFFPSLWHVSLVVAILAIYCYPGPQLGARFVWYWCPVSYWHCSHWKLPGGCMFEILLLKQTFAGTG